MLGAIIQSAQVGLEVGSVLGHAYLVPFWNSKARYSEVQFIPGYRGLMELARRSGAVKKIAAHVVYENDVFEFEYGMEEKLVHRPEMKKDRGKLFCAYAVATIDDGTSIIEVVPLSDIHKIRDASLAKIKEEMRKYSPWTTSEDEMARKTAVRRIFKYLPISLDKHEKLAEAIRFDNQRDDDPFFDVETIESPIKDVAPIPPPSEGNAELNEMKDLEHDKLLATLKERIRLIKSVEGLAHVKHIMEDKYDIQSYENLTDLSADQVSEFISIVGGIK